MRAGTGWETSQGKPRLLAHASSPDINQTAERQHGAQKAGSTALAASRLRLLTACRRLKSMSMYLLVPQIP